MMALRRLAMVLLSFFALAANGCVRDIVNDNASLRWFLFSEKGAPQVCPSMLARGLPLRLEGSDTASTGRFFPRTCHSQLHDDKRSLSVEIQGDGYLRLPIAERIGFTARLTVEYLPDFRLEKDATYVWGTYSKTESGPDIAIVGSDNPVVDLATKTPLGDVASVLAGSVAKSQIAQGFTVVRQDDGDDFALGRVEPPAKPKRAFQPGDDHFQLESDTVAVAAGARAFLGPFALGDDAALFVHTKSSAALNFTVAGADVAAPLVQAYEKSGSGAALPGAMTLPTTEATQSFSRGAGAYYVIVENPASSTAPPPPFPDDAADATIVYSVEVGDR